MSSIWNPQDRYILSNMTSEKLYAKSPLTTGVSGTSAYIGLEPSATYNETVLWSGVVSYNGSLLTANLAEPVTNFETIKLYMTRGAMRGDFVLEVPSQISGDSYAATLIAPTGNNIYLYYDSFTMTGSQYKEISGECGYKGLDGDTTRNKTGNWLHPYKIIGINRKEV